MADENANALCEYPGDSQNDFDSDYDDDDYDLDEEFEMVGKKIAASGYNPANNGVSKSVNLKKFEGRIVLEKYMPKVANEISRLESQEEKGNTRIKDKQDRATIEQVLDPKTRMILLKMINQKMIESVNGCVSTGKEANVYHAGTKEGLDRAIKVYKTSILVFKDRDKYVSGEFRFRNGYCRSNPRKMVRTWAEKEMRNLTRIHSCGIRCPQPFMLRSHVLVMEFIGVSGIPAPLLKEVSLSESTARKLYLECILMIRKLYKDAKLVHADLSEFNLLFHENSIVVIDVSQSVEHDHPRAIDFLRKDCCNINHFFRKNGVLTLTLRELFDFVTDPNLLDDDVDQYLEKLQETASGRTLAELESLEKESEEHIFLNSYLPKRLDEVIDFERDLEQGDQVIYGTITAMKPDLSGAQTKATLLISDEEEEDSSLSSESSNEEETQETQNKRVPVGRPKNETPEERRERKKAVKEQQREKRKDKMPKHIKKRLTKRNK